MDKHVAAVRKRAAEFISENDPFGDHFSRRDVMIIAGESVAPPLEQCPVCGGDCAAANPPVIDCPMQDRD